MIRHIVMFKLNDALTQDEKKLQIQTAIDLTKDFQAEIPTLINFELTTNSDLAPASNYDIALVCDFENIEGLDEYQTHPKHLKFGEFITAVRENRACIDYEF